MATRDSRRTKAPALAAVTADTTSRRIVFADDRLSLLGGLPHLAANLPSVRYDPTIDGERLDIDAKTKAHALVELGDTSHAVTSHIKIIGKLMAAQDRTAGYLDHQDVVELGFALHGFGDIAQQLALVADRIEAARPADALEDARSPQSAA